MHRWICLLGCSAALALASGPPPPSGWQSQQQGTTWVLQPRGLQQGEVYQLVVFPAVQVQPDLLQDWFSKAVLQDARKRGLAGDPVEVQNLQGILVSTLQVTVQGKVRHLLYFGLENGKGAGQLVLQQVSNHPELAQLHQPGTSAVLARLREGLSEASLQPDQTPTAQPAGQNTSAASSAATTTFKWTTPPGKGLQAAQIQGLYLDFRNRFRGTALVYSEHLTLLLKDGTAYTGLRVPPEDLDVKASRKNEPEAWTRWKTSGNKRLIWNPNASSWEEMKGRPVVAARKGEVLQGTFAATQVSGAGAGAGSIQQQQFVFRKDGSFEIERTLETSSNGGTQVQGYSKSNKNGSQGAVSTSSGVGTTSQNQQDQPDLYGTYQLSGHVLTLRLKNGQVLRKLFFYTSTQKDTLFIENVSHYPLEQNKP